MESPALAANPSFDTVQRVSIASQIRSPSPRLMSAAGTGVRCNGGQLRGLPPREELFDPALPLDFGDTELGSGCGVEAEDFSERVELLLGTA